MHEAHEETPILEVLAGGGKVSLTCLLSITLRSNITWSLIEATVVHSCLVFGNLKTILSQFYKLLHRFSVS